MVTIYEEGSEPFGSVSGVFVEQMNNYFVEKPFVLWN